MTWEQPDKSGSTFAPLRSDGPHGLGPRSMLGRVVSEAPCRVGSATQIAPEAPSAYSPSLCLRFMRRGQCRVRIRRYRPTDLAFVVEGLDRILAEKAAAASSHEITPAPRWGRSYASSLLKFVRDAKGVSMVAEVRQDRAGFAFGAPDRGVPRWMMQSSAFTHRCSVLEIHVAPRFRNLEVGPKLVAEIERRFARRGYDWITASYHEGHRFEADLYQRSGFEPNSVGVARWIDRPTRK